MRRVVQDQRGVTLIEMMVVVVLSGIVMGTTLTTFTQFERTTAVNERQNEAQEQVRTGLAGLARELRNLASPTDQLPEAVVRADASDIVFQSVSSSATRRVRYCLDASGGRLWRQVQYEPFSDPSTSSCPDATWGSERAAVENVTNGTRAVFTYNSTEVTSITEITSSLWVDVNPGEPPLETALQTSIFLRNQNRAPLASFTATVSGSTIVLNGSDSSDPEGKALEFFWYDADETGNECGTLPDAVPQTGCVGTGIVFNYEPAAPGTRQLHLVASDPAGLTDAADQVSVCVPGEGVTC
ncbi:MAG: prepilin-type N-terminal cleavage/methylation domain-containing protein [Thermoleophilaceae bacterium]